VCSRWSRRWRCSHAKSLCMAFDFGNLRKPIEGFQPFFGEQGTDKLRPQKPELRDLRMARLERAAAPFMQHLLRHAEDHARDTAPVNRADTHRARLGAAIQRTAMQRENPLRTTVIADHAQFRVISRV